MKKFFISLVWLGIDFCAMLGRHPQMIRATLGMPIKHKRIVMALTEHEAMLALKPTAMTTSELVGQPLMLSRNERKARKLTKLRFRSKLHCSSRCRNGHALGDAEVFGDDDGDSTRALPKAL